MYYIMIICQTLAIGNICLFQTSGDWETQEVYPVVWVSHPTSGDGESVITFSWAGKLSLACISSVEHTSAKPLVAVMESVFITATVNPKDRSKKAAVLSLKNGSYQFRPDETEIDDQKSVVLKTDWNIPNVPHAKAGLCMDDCFIGMVNLGPNLTYKINTETEYGLLFGAYKQGDRLKPSDIENSLRFSSKDFDEQNKKAFILQSDNVFLPIKNDLIPNK
jgi:hypothetical protein